MPSRSGPAKTRRPRPYACSPASWPEVKVPLRVIRSRESYWLCRPRSRQRAEQSSDWIWVTTLPAAQLSTERAVA
jgi:hypothetical protein